MTNYPQVQFVSAPEAGADVRFDFNTAGEWSDDETWPEHDGFSLGAPALEGDPDAYGVEYGLRQLEFNVIISGTQADASKQWSRLAKELVGRRTNWLRFRFSSASPTVFFKTYRTAPEALDFEQVDDTDDAATNLWGLGVQLAAEPFAYGERVTLSALTINNNPTAATNPCFAVLPEILGDAPAAARFDMSADALHSIPSPMFSVTPVPDDFAAPIVYDFGSSDTVTAYTDMDAAVTGPAGTYAGASYRPITFATDATLVRRASVPIANLRPGRYAVLLRVMRSNTSAQFAFQAVVNGRVAGSVVSMDRPASPSVNYAQWLDLGTFTFPTGLFDYDATQMFATSLDLHASRLTATGTAKVDSMVLMPVELIEDEPGMRLTTLPDFLGDTGTYVNRWEGDGEYHQVYRDASYPMDRAYGSNPAVLKGQFPVLTPGYRNVLHLFRQTESAAREDGKLGDLRTTTDNGDVVSMTTSVTISYHPRWLWLAGS